MENIENGAGNEVNAAENGAKKRNMPPEGRRFTKENASAMGLSSARARKLRKDARNQMLQALCTKLNLGDELVKSVQEHDFNQVQLLEKAIKMVGVHFEQSAEAAQNIKVESKSEVNAKLSSPNLSITFTDKLPDPE